MTKSIKNHQRAPLLILIALLAVFLPVFARADTAESQQPLIKKGDEGDNVILLQMRLADLGYFDTAITGYFGDVTENAVIAFQKENKLTADGKVGQQTSDVLFSNEAVREPVVAVKKPVVKAVSKCPNGKLRDWFTYVNARWQRGEKCLVIDYATGIQYYMIRVGGYNHADAEPATAADCAKFLKTYGGSWSWDRRAVVVRIGGEYIAASTNGYPHGYETVKNNDMYGQICIHFLNSRNHVHNLLDPTHQAMVKKASGNSAATG